MAARPPSYAPPDVVTAGAVPSAELALARLLADVDPRERPQVEEALTKALLRTVKPTTRAALEEAVRRLGAHQTSN